MSYICFKLRRSYNNGQSNFVENWLLGVETCKGKIVTLIAVLLHIYTLWTYVDTYFRSFENSWFAKRTKVMIFAENMKLTYAVMIVAYVVIIMFVTLIFMCKYNRVIICLWLINFVFLFVSALIGAEEFFLLFLEKCGCISMSLVN